MKENAYLCIDLKSFYASVECVERGLDPMTANLAVADPARGKGSVCLAISPSMKALGIKNRCRVYQIPQYVEYITAPPRMKLYIKYSADIYGVYLKYIAKEDIHMYSIDEAFLDVTHYLSLYQKTARELALDIMADIRTVTGIPAAAGVGSNLYLAKVSLDILAKHGKDSIACLNEEQYRDILWDHRPLTDFWRVGDGTAKRLSRIGIRTMREIAQADEEVLYRMLGVDAELLIDHAWGRESTTLKDIKAYTPKSSSFSSGQVLPRDYSFEESKLIVKEMMDGLCLEMEEEDVTAKSVTLTVGYSNATGKEPDAGTVTLPQAARAYQTLIPKVVKLYERIARKEMPIRKITLTCNGVTEESYGQYDLFGAYEAEEKDRKIQRAVLEIKRKFGKNALIRGMDLLEAGTSWERNHQFGGLRSG